MQTFRSFTVSIFIAGAAVLSACSSTRPMQVLVTHPAATQMPADVRRLVIVNRSEGKATTAIEGILTGEMPGIDNTLSEECLSGLFQGLRNNPRFQITRYTSRLRSASGTSTGFGSPIDWTTIENIAAENNADAVLTLEYFDSDYRITNVSRPGLQGAVWYQAVGNITGGFRIYFPKTKTIFYEQGLQRRSNIGDQALSQSQIIAKGIRGPEALKNLSYSLGQSFGNVFTVYNAWENRALFKGNNTTARGNRLAVTNNWQQAVDAWQAAYRTETSNNERGKLAYNLALGYEVLSNLFEAKKWITASFVEHGNKKAQAYADILNQRIDNEPLLQQQRESLTQAN